MQKKDNTKGKGARRECPMPAQLKAAKEIVAHLSAVLNNPHTPESLSDNIHTGLCELNTPHEVISSATYIEQELIGEFIANGKGGANR